jgi:2-isopropylmalate synthase
VTTNELRPIKIFDTTLRDGEQSPGASMNLNEKLEIAQALSALGVDIIEAGFPIASPGDFEAVREISRNIRGTTICGLARCNPADIDRAWEALKLAERPRIHVFLATSAIHREFKLRMTREEIIQRAVEGVKRAAGYCDDIEFSPEDAARTEHDFLCQVVEAAIEAGATTVNIPDTVGYAVPIHMGQTIDMLRNRVPNIDRAVISVHCHDDLGLAVANSFGGGGARCRADRMHDQRHRRTRRELLAGRGGDGDPHAQRLLRCCTSVNTQRLVPTSRLVVSVTGMQVQRNKAIVGRNAFAHEAGIHQDGMLKERTTYEIMRPEDVGFTQTDLVLGKHSGRAALNERAKTLGFQLTGEQLQAVFEEFKKLADKKKEIYDGDIVALIEQRLHQAVEEEWSLVLFEAQCGSGRTPSAKLTLRCGDREHTAEVTAGDGPIDAAFCAVEKIINKRLSCKGFEARSATVGRDALGEVTMEIEHNGITCRGRGASTDTVEAAVMAILNAVNRIEAESRRAATQNPAPPVEQLAP